MFRTNWTNACEIFRDLSVAQGDVPVSVEGTLSAGDKPPALNIKEETEEEYFLCSGDGVIDEGPDLGLIQDMLDMVREENLSDDETPQETLVVITKPTTVTTPAIPVIIETQEIVKKKKQKRRNIALESFIGIDVTPKSELKLLKPEDLITKPNVVEPDLCAVESAINKVNDWLLSNEETTVSKKPAVCLEAPTNMFRKKTKGKSPVGSSKENLSIKTGSNPKSPNQSQLKEFIPSAYATEYCNKYKEKAKLKENVVEDIWTRAEKQMKMMDEKRKAETATESLASHGSDTAAATDIVTTTDTSETPDTSAISDTAATTVTLATTAIAATTIIEATADITAALLDPREATTTPNEQNIKKPQDPREKVELPGHRHLLTDDCIVCQAFTEFGYTGFSEKM